MNKSAWVAGRLLSYEEAQLDSAGWPIGTGIFETIKTVDGQPWALSRHMRRAVNSALRLNLPLPGEELLRSSIELLLATEKYEVGALRVSFDHTGNWAAVHNPYEEKSKPAKLVTYQSSLISDGVPIKSYPYKHRLDILKEVGQRGFDEAIVVNGDSKICEGAVTNLLFLIGNQWCTTPLSDGVLPGIMRALVIENFKVQVRSIEIDELSKVKSGFLLSSLRIAQPISSIDGRELAHSHEFEDEIRAMALRTSVG